MAQYASIVLDIPTRALTSTYDYRVPEGLGSQVQVGSTVLVTFSGRAAVGYVTNLSDQVSPGVNPGKLRDIESEPGIRSDGGPGRALDGSGVCRSSFGLPAAAAAARTDGEGA